MTLPNARGMNHRELEMPVRDRLEPALLGGQIDRESPQGARVDRRSFSALHDIAQCGVGSKKMIRRIESRRSRQ